MAIDAKAVFRIALLLAIGLLPALVVLVVVPSRGGAIAATGNAAMAIAFVLWIQSLMGETREAKLQEAAVRAELAALEEKARDQARELRDARTLDTGTGVLNRVAFFRRLDEAITRDARLGKELAVLVVDVEGFRSANNERGSTAGDAILKRVARVLEEATRGTDCVGRLGGDEFGVVLAECSDPSPAVRRTFAILEAEASSGAVIHLAIGGVTIENPAAGVDVHELLRLADDALVSVRGSGANGYASRTMCSAADAEPASECILRG